MRGLVLLMVVGIVLLSACAKKRSRCEMIDGASATRSQLEDCLAEVRRTSDADLALAVARGFLAHGQQLSKDGTEPLAQPPLVTAAKLAQELAHGEHRAAALAVLESVARERGEPSRAQELSDSHLAWLIASERASEASRQAHAEAGRRWMSGDVVGAMHASRLAVAQADRASDAPMQAFARLGLADLYRHHDQLADAENTLALAEQLAPTHSARAWAAAKQGMLFLDRGLDAIAKERLLHARELIGAAQADAALRLSIHLNLAWLYRRTGEHARAEIELTRAEALAPEDVDVWLGRGLLAAAQGALDLGAQRLEGAAARAADDRERWWVWYHAGRLHQQRGDQGAAQAAYQRSMRHVRALATTAGPYVGELAASHRLPYSRAVGLAARRGDWRGALALVLELDELALVAAENVREDAASAPESYGTGRSGRALPTSLTVDELLAAWRDRPLTIVLDDQETVWRLEVQGGQVTGTALGSTQELERAADALEADPSASQPARLLSAALAPASWSDAPVYVLTIGPLSRTPLAAVERPAAAPLVRVLGLRPSQPRTLSDPRTVVLGDPRGDLPHARAEAEAVAARLGVPATLGSAADRRAVEAARGAALLHVAAHSSLDEAGPALLLADAALSATTLATLSPAPRVVVMASCGSAAARDDGRWGSLAAAYLAAGADAVIASAWTVNDADTRRFIDELYRHPVAQDPVRALAAAQAAVRTTLPPRAWAAFTVIAAPPRAASRAAASVWKASASRTFPHSTQLRHRP